MSLILPLMLRDMMAVTRPMRMLENHLRLTEEMFQVFATPTATRLKNPAEFSEEQTESVIQDQEKFQIKLDVQNFKPEEITVKTIDNNFIQIEAKHEENEENKSFLSRQLIRRFLLPENHEMKDVVSNLSSDGILTITAPRKAEALEQERIIPITHVGPEKNTEDKKTE